MHGIDKARCSSRSSHSHLTTEGDLNHTEEDVCSCLTAFTPKGSSRSKCTANKGVSKASSCSNGGQSPKAPLLSLPTPSPTPTQPTAPVSAISLSNPDTNTTVESTITTIANASLCQTVPHSHLPPQTHTHARARIPVTYSCRQFAFVVVLTYIASLSRTDPTAN
jgi:hypothetical protein